MCWMTPHFFINPANLLRQLSLSKIAGEHGGSPLSVYRKMFRTSGNNSLARPLRVETVSLAAEHIHPVLLSFGEVLH